MRKLKEIIIGYWNLMFASPAERMEGVRRLDICKSCKYKRGHKCGECGCILVAKVMCDICECPKGKW